MMPERENPIGAAGIDWDETGLPRSRQFEDIYFSKDNGLAETQYVFLEQNQLAQRFANLEDAALFVVAETGFGTGLNFLATWQLWQQQAPQSATLHFISVEKFPLNRSDLRRALSLWPELSQFSKQLLEKYPRVNQPGHYRIKFANVALSLLFDEAQDGLEQLFKLDGSSGCGEAKRYHWCKPVRAHQAIDAWFLDGFAPAKNPQMWTPKLFNTMAQLSSETTTVSTFTCAGVVKQGLTQAGFTIEKKPGFGRKREMLCAKFSAAQSAERPSKKLRAAWHLCDLSTVATPVDKNVAIIGSGLAGTTTAAALAKRGFEVTVYEQKNIGNGASGNPVGILYSKLSHARGPYSDFSLCAYLYALQYYQDLGVFEQMGERCGLHQLLEPDQEEKTTALLARFDSAQEFVRPIPANELNTELGISCGRDALSFSQAGWVSPQKVCHALLDHSNITVIENTEITLLQHNGQSWQLSAEKSAASYTHAIVVIANAHDAPRFAQTHGLPAKGIRGQISYAKPSANSAKLKSVICHDSYVTPVIEGKHCIGASYDLNSCDRQLRMDEHLSNLHNARSISSDFAGLEVQDISDGRASVRCTTPDYLPILGAAPELKMNAARFKHYRHNGKEHSGEPGHYHPNLYVNYGYGSKGLSFSPLCAETLACMLNAEPLPLPRRLLLHLHPLRFLIRELIRNKA